jgi:hypothetical protein
MNLHYCRECKTVVERYNTIDGFYSEICLRCFRKINQRAEQSWTFCWGHNEEIRRKLEELSTIDSKYI